MDAPLDDRALNRALLARQHLLTRATAGVEQVVRDVVGLQAQNPWSPFVGLWSRVAGFRTDALDALLLDRRVVRIAVMRSTVHLVTAADAAVLANLLRPVLHRELRSNPQRRTAADAVDLDLLARSAAAHVGARPQPTTRLGAHLATTWPDVDPKDLAAFARALLPLVQVPPRGLWRGSAAPTLTTLDVWAPGAVAAAGDLADPAVRRRAEEDVVLRYLGAYGPASVADVQTWSGLRGLRAVVDRVRDRLVELPVAPSAASGRARTLLDLPGAPRPDPEHPAPVRYLADYDDVWLAHARRERIIDDVHRRRLQTPNGRSPAAVLVDGRVRATWAVDRARTGDRARATLDVTPLEPLTTRERRGVLEEGEAFVRFVADDAAEHAVRLATG
ncbi:winged helix DNA-binding domain-containing protein [Cellulomonas shaoxiangyii]|uniref:Winged helix DNA-binding domain-containing protein n=1 Tax=Cellulomonas shaoxiangyii TaxID=2566013 RepID=A0A4P7SG63_9CELL|nr:winged helix DNA-binding domain-containing protein [Cellulomonas shaoxiangyii]QCB93159.1 winged helix DNA-binding domain-containing protein [Cellulomonas shaoxiangyii]TGY79652.1 winged helix DNA-binding domain-containing protein [Cellulomonas shaoxiangyii]